MPGTGAEVSRLPAKAAAISAFACAARSRPTRRAQWCSSAAISPHSAHVTSPPPSACSAATIWSSAPQRMAGSGSSAPAARRVCRRSSNGCDGPALMRSPTRSPGCRDGFRSALSIDSKTSMTARPIAASCRAAASDLLLQMLLQPLHQLDEVARAEAVVELVHEDALPGVAARAGRARQGEEVGAAGDAGRRPALDRRGADLVVAEPAEELAEPGDLFLVDAVEGLRCHIAPGDPGAAGRDYDVDRRIGDPRPQLGDDFVLLVADDAPRGDVVAGGRGEIGERTAGAVLRRVAAVGNRQQRDVDGQEGTGFIEPRHQRRLPSGSPPWCERVRIVPPSTSGQTGWRRSGLKTERSEPWTSPAAKSST